MSAICLRIFTLNQLDRLSDSDRLYLILLYQDDVLNDSVFVTSLRRDPGLRQSPVPEVNSLLNHDPISLFLSAMLCATV